MTHVKMTDGENSAHTTTTQSSIDSLHYNEGNGEDDEENSLLLSAICRLEIENLRMRKSINNYGFNLKQRVLELEHEKKELINAIKLLKPQEDPSKFAISDNSKYVNVEFSEIAEAFTSAENSGGRTRNRSRSSSGGGSISNNTRRPFADSTQPFDNTPYLAFPGSMERVQSDTTTSQPEGEEGEESDLTPVKSGDARLSLRQKPFLTQSVVGGGSVPDGGDTTCDTGSQDGDGGDEGKHNHKRQSTEIALSSMRLSMQNPIMDIKIKQNFLEFYMIGAERAILSGAKVPVISQQQPTEILNRYPAENTVFMNSIADFVFPRGAFMHLTRSYAYARSILKAKPTQYHILQFSDAQGVPTFACCLTVTSVLRLDPSRAQQKDVIAHLTPLLTRLRARRVLVRFFRLAHVLFQGRRRVIVNNKGEVVGYLSPRPHTTAASAAAAAASKTKSTPASSPPSFLKFKNSFVHRFGGKNSNGSDEGAGSRSSSRSSRGKNDLSRRSGFARAISKARDAREGDSEEVSETSSSDGAGDDDESDGSANTSPSSSSSKKRSKSRKHRKLKSDEQEEYHYLISQQAYVLLSAKPLHTFLFRILEEIAQREGRNTVTTTAGAESPGRAEIENTDEALALMMSNSLQENVSARDKFLKYMQCHPLRQAKAGSLQDMVFFNFPSYIEHRIQMKFNQISMDEWANALLFSLLSPSLVMFLLNALMLEKSIIVSGSNISLVSTLTSAIVQLLRPFTWEGVFIPLIPANAIEILEAPVPFVVGTNIPFRMSNISPSANVLFVDEVLRCYMESEFPLEEMMGKRCLYRSKDATVNMPVNQNLRYELNSIHTLLSRSLPPCFHYSPNRRDVKEIETQIFNFQLSYFFNEGSLSQEVRYVIGDIARSLQKHNRVFAGDISGVDGGWRKYGIYDPSSSTFNFFPQWFMGHQSSVLEFQTSLVNTQLFYSYVDRAKLTHMKRQFCRRFIADFLAYQFGAWTRRRKALKGTKRK